MSLRNSTDAPNMIAGRGHSRKNSRDLDEIDEDGSVSFLYVHICIYISSKMCHCVLQSVKTFCQMLADQ